MKRLPYLILLAILLLTACGPKKTEMEQRIDQAERTWSAKKMDAYILDVKCISVWSIQNIHIEVRGDQVVSHSATCERSLMTSGDCKVEEYTPENFTVAGLFRNARKLAGVEKPQYAEIEFSPTYGFPAILGYNDPDMYDEEWSCTALLR